MMVNVLIRNFLNNAERRNEVQVEYSGQNMNRMDVVEVYGKWC